MKKSQKALAKEVLASRDTWITLDETAAVLRCGRNTLRRRIADGKLNDLKLMAPFGDGKVLVLKESLQTLISKRMQQTAKDYKLPPSYTPPPPVHASR